MEPGAKAALLPARPLRGHRGAAARTGPGGRLGTPPQTLCRRRLPLRRPRARSLPPAAARRPRA
eukprot:15484342-Alexandrium_andersonii.AAC.1